MICKNKLNYLSIPDRSEIENVSTHFSINKYISAVLIQRLGYNTDKIRHFLNPEGNKLGDPFLIEGMTEAINLVLDSINNSENILIYGDYDVDGITATSILFKFLKKSFNLKGELIYRTASRFDEGYGLSIDAVNLAILNNIRLIITVDCGTKDYESIKLARDNKIKVIVIDHHEFGEEENCANVILNPKNPKCKYQFKELTGCGVAFKFIQALCKNQSIDVNIDDFLDLVSLSICCDIVPIIDENRTLLVRGLKKINESPNLGLKCFIDRLGLIKVDVNDILFRIGPRLNAPGRINNPIICVDLFVNDDIDKISNIFDKIDDCYLTRKRFCNEAVKEIDANIDKIADSKSIIFYNKNWNLGILGILASKCVEKKNTPSIIMSNRDDNYIVGSIRSINEVNAVELLNSCNNFLVKYGGHKMAAGFLLEKSKLEGFVDFVSKKLENALKNNDIKKTLNIDIRLPLREINDSFYKDLVKISPFGFGNEQPIFESTVKIIDYYFSYYDTICTITDKAGYKLFGMIKNNNVVVNGVYKIQYKVGFNNSIFLNIENFEKIN